MSSPVRETPSFSFSWVQPLADRIGLDTARLRRVQRHLDRQHRTGSAGCFRADGTHQPGRCGWQRSNTAKRTITRLAELHRRLAFPAACLIFALLKESRCDL